MKYDYEIRKNYVNVYELKDGKHKYSFRKQFLTEDAAIEYAKSVESLHSGFLCNVLTVFENTSWWREEN